MPPRSSEAPLADDDNGSPGLEENRKSKQDKILEAAIKEYPNGNAKASNPKDGKLGSKKGSGETGPTATSTNSDKDEGTESDELKKEDVGRDATIKTFYEGPSTCKCCINWVEKQPTQVPKFAREKYGRAALRLYKVKDHGSRHSTFGGLTSLRFHSLEIQSPDMTSVLRPILREEGMMLTDEEPVKVGFPFQELFFGYEKIKEAINAKCDNAGPGLEHMVLLQSFLKDLFRGARPAIAQLTAQGLMTFEHAWALFPRGSRVYARIFDQDRILQVEKVHLQTRPELGWNVSCSFIQFDGKSFGTAQTMIFVKVFQGKCLITNLSVYPLEFHADTGLEAALVDRGVRALSYQDITYVEYEGVAYDEDVRDDEPPKKVLATGRIVVDQLGYGKFNPERTIHVKSLDVLKTKSLEQGSSSNSADIISSDSHFDEFDYVEKRLTQKEKALNTAELQGHTARLGLISPMLPGFSLVTKEWLLFTIDKCRPIRWNDQAFDHLVYSSEKKNLLLSFVRNHSPSSERTTDVVAGKGQGLVVLLSGPPGTGKTLTAEAIADQVRRPLYRVQAEDLGTDAYYLGRHLSRALNIATEWNALVLLDECDVFLSKRSVENINRNELVSIFLRELDYYRGILFLTTNLLNNIDDAFRSRVHLHFLYEPLTRVSRFRIWKKFLERWGSEVKAEATTTTDVAETKTACAAGLLEDGEIEALAAWRLNGREIKNVVKIAQTWCRNEGFHLNYSRLQTGIQVSIPWATRDEE